MFTFLCGEYHPWDKLSIHHCDDVTMDIFIFNVIFCILFHSTGTRIESLVEILIENINSHALSQRVTFQCFLITDGDNTFAVINYMDINMAPIENFNISIGYRYKKDLFVKNSFTKQEGSFKMSLIPGNRGIFSQLHQRWTKVTTIVLKKYACLKLIVTYIWFQQQSNVYWSFNKTFILRI